MAGPLQVGDIISLGRIAWDIYRFGWTEDHNATRQYAEFGRDVRGLAENLDILSRVVVCADNSLQSQRRPGVSARLRWDRTSLIEIIGDYEMTLRECDQLLRSNNRYRVGSNPLRNLEWNVLVQPTADQLRQKIMLHNSKILHILKPFEVDLLLRVRQDIEFMHRDLADRITAAHHDIRRLMGVLIPDLDEALDQRVQRSAVLLEVPVDLNDQFRFAALTGHPEYRIEDDFELSELSDAFILNFHKSTVNFESGMLVEDPEIVDFDITSMVFNPQYALPSGTHMAQEIILRQNERIARLDFLDGGDILKFQQAITGFKPWASVTQYDCQVIFVLGGVKETIMENACLQLWIPKPTEGSLVTNSDAAANAIKSPPSSRQNSISTLASGAIPSSPLSGGRSFASSGSILTPNGSNGGGLSASPPGRHPSLPTIPQRQATGPMLYGSWPERSSPELIGSSPIERQNFIPIPGPPRQFPPRKPVGQSPSPCRSGSLLPAASASTATTKNGRSFSISSGMSSNSNSSNSDVRSVSISTGTNSTGLLHKRPVKPMLVAFTQSRQGDRFSFVTIQIDDETNMNPERCNCRRSGRDGASCDIAAIEKKKGDAPIAARRYEQSASDGEMDWNLARLALNNPASTSDGANWPNLKRLSIKFPTAQARAKFCGTPNVCHCKIKKEADLLKCIQERHRGLWGEVQENYRRQMNSFHKQRYESRSHVVYGVTN
ncbi:hypothetical protein ACHAPU_007809 [Fusarium lateritium]